MFTVYGLSGQVFNGPIESLYRVNQLARLAAARPPTGREEEPVADAATLATPAHQALRSYRAMLPQELERGPLIHAAQVMSRPAITVAAQAPVKDAWRTLRDNRIRQAPVLDAERRLVGIVSERDLLTAVDIEDGQLVGNTLRRTEAVMTTPVVASHPITDIRRIAAAMVATGAGGVPIVGEDGQLLGFVSRGDVLRAVVKDPPLSLWR